MQNVDRDSRVLRIGAQAVDSRQVNQHQVAAPDAAQFADSLFDGHARVVGYLLPQAGEAIKERRFARVRRPHQGYRLNLARRSRSRGKLNRDWGATTHRLPSFPVAASLDWRTRIDLAVSRRSAISRPSIAYTVGSPAGARRNAVTL